VAIPTAIAALIIHITRLLSLDASIRRDIMEWRAEQGCRAHTMMTLITINRVYYLIGFVVMLLVVMTLRDRANPAFYNRVVLVFVWRDLPVWRPDGTELGKSLAYRIIGGGVIAIALLAGFSLVRIGYYKMSTEEARVASSNILKN
jgi:uncharacterized membrane protein